MPDPFDLPQRLCLTPAFDPDERALLAGFATASVRRVWPRQPGARSPWTPCEEGCCLLLGERVGSDRAARWLRFLLRELVAPRAADARRRAEEAGLRPHRVDGRVLLEGGSGGPRLLLRVTDSRVREIGLDDDLFPLEPSRSARAAADVVELRRRCGRGESD